MFEGEIFASWSGGYLDSDRWKLNSGVKGVEQDEDYYYFIGYSGSVYKCYKKGYGITSGYGYAVLNDIIKKSQGKAELMIDREDWKTIEK